MRLIDADKLKELRHQYIQGRIKFDGSEYDLIDKCPTVDAVEVVRCENCKHARERNKSERNYLVEGVLICTSCDAVDSCWNPVLPDHFCSYGEPRSHQNIL